MTSTISELATSGMRNSTTNTFIMNITPKNRIIREKPILGIDYDKLRYGNRKNALSSLSQCSSPRDSLTKNLSTTGAQFRVTTPSHAQEKLNVVINNNNINSVQNLSTRYDLKNMPHKKLSSKESSQQQQYFLADKRNNDKTENNNITSEEQADYDTFKKYQKEFQEFRRQKYRMQTSHGGVSERGASRSKWYQEDNIGQNNSNTMRISQNRHSRSKVFTDKSLDQKSFGKVSERLFDSVRRSRQTSEWVQPQQQEQQSKQLDQNNQNESEQPKLLEVLTDVGQINSGDNLQSPKNININNKEGTIPIPAQNTNINRATSNLSNNFMEKTSTSWRCQPQQENDAGQLTQQSSSSCPCSSEQTQPTYYSKMVDRYIDINSDYYKHLTGDCLCGHCICGKCRCPYKSIPVDLKRALQTNYQHDFNTPSAIAPVPTISMPFFTQQQQLPNINTVSTNQQDFKPPEGADLQIFAKAPSQKSQTGPFLATSSYQSNFIDWKTKQVGHVRAPQDLTIAADIPFIAKSLYADSYGKDKKPQKDKEFEEFIKGKSKSMFSSPLNPDFRIIPQSTNQQFFSSPKFYPSAMFNPYQGETELTPAVPDQFKSQAAREYDDKSKVQCPSQLIIMQMNKRLKKKNELEFEKSKTKYEEIAKDKKAVTMNQLFENAKIKPQRLLVL